jgi:hypothetical protein
LNLPIKKTKRTLIGMILYDMYGSEKGERILKKWGNFCFIERELCWIAAINYLIPFTLTKEF